MKLLHSLLLIILFFGKISAQSKLNSNQDIDQLVVQYRQLFLANQKLIDGLKSDKSFEDDKLLITFLNQNTNIVQEKTNSIDRFNSNSVSNFGLKWVSDFTHNFGFGGSDEEDIYFKSRVSTGLDWVIFGEGSYVKHRRDLKIDQIENKRDSLEIALDKNSDLLQIKTNQLKYIFDIRKIELLKKYESFLKEKLIYTNSLFEAKLINNTDLLRVQNDYSRIKNEIEFNEGYLLKDNNSNFLAQFQNIPELDLELPNLDDLKINNLFPIDSEIIELKKELIRTNRKNSDLPSFRTKFRYNFFNSDGNFDRKFASIGASLSIPIRFGKDEALHYKIEKFDRQLEKQRLDAKSQLEKIHFEFYFYKNELKNTQNDLIYLEALLENEILIFEKHKSNFSPEKYIEYSFQFFKTKLDILNIKLKISENFIAFHILYGSPSTKKHNDQDKISSYLWNESFRNNSNEQLIKVLNKNNINLLFLSSEESNQEKLDDFVNLSNQNGIKIHRLIGENSFAINESGQKKLLRKLNTIDKTKFSGIHLDIEPHTFSDYRENIEQYTENMNMIFKLANQWCEENNLDLSVSIPMTLPEKNAKVLKKEKIKAYIMAYENTDQNKLLKRTENLRAILKDNFVWVLRLSDFQDKEELNEVLNELKKQHISEIGYYDVSNLLNQN